MVRMAETGSLPMLTVGNEAMSTPSSVTAKDAVGAGGEAASEAPMLMTSPLASSREAWGGWCPSHAQKSANAPPATYAWRGSGRRKRGSMSASSDAAARSIAAGKRLAGVLQGGAVVSAASSWRSSSRSARAARRGSASAAGADHERNSAGRERRSVAMHTRCDMSSAGAKKDDFGSRLRGANTAGRRV